MGRTSLFLTLLLPANSFQRSLIVTEMTLGFFVGAVRCFVGFSISVALLLVFGMRLLMILLRTLLLVLVDLVDWPGLGTVTVSLATLAASSVSMATSTARAKVRSVSLILKRAFKTASLLTEHMNLWRRASSCGSWIEGKSQVVTVLTYTRCQLLKSFAWFPLHVTPELEAFTNNEDFWVKLFLHKVNNFQHG